MVPGGSLHPGGAGAPGVLPEDVGAHGAATERCRVQARQGVAVSLLAGERGPRSSRPDQFLDHSIVNGRPE